jgi:hypothetical protein
VARVPAALVMTAHGEGIVVKLFGDKFEGSRWWDARCVYSREWEDVDGSLIADIKPDIAAKIDAIMATATDHHELAGKELSDRVRRGVYAIAE